MTRSWRVERVVGPAGWLHRESAALLGSEPVSRAARILVAESPAVVLGSHEPEAWFDPAALSGHGLELARRRSGGGAVVVGGGHTVWVDFVLPAADPLWDDDVGRAAWWVGDLWADVIRAAGAADRPEVWRGAMRPSRWSPLVCFAGVGPGEVEVAGAKVVGVSQRRTRHAALFQSAALLRWDPGLWASLVSGAGRAAAGRAGPGDGAAGSPDRDGPPADLAGAARALGPDMEEQLVSAMTAALDAMIF